MPHNQVPNYIRAGPWDCIEKKSARSLTIIDVYRHFFERHIPEDKEYWSMCGAHFDKNGLPLLGELGYLVENKLINKQQFFGVDRELTIIEKNKGLFPEVHWIHGDFIDTMESYLLDKQFNPAIINYDGIMQPKFGVRYLKRILKLLDYNFSSEVLLISNFILTNPYSRSEKLSFNIDDTLNELSSVYWMPDHWQILPKAYVYSGISRNANSQVGVIIFIKDKHNPDNITYTENRKIGKGEF